MHLKKLRLTNLGPFDDIEFEFDERVNVFTGPNNSGKSTALMALGEIVVYPFILPRKLLKSDAAEFKAERWPDEVVFEGLLPLEGKQLNDAANIFLLPESFSSFVPAVRRSTDFRVESPIVKKRQESLEVLQHRRSRQRSKRSALDADASDSNEENEEIRKRRKLIETDASSVSDEDVVQKIMELDKRRKLIETDASSVSDEDVVRKIIELDYRAYRRVAPAIRGIVDKTAAIASEVTEGYPIEFIRVDEDDDGLFPQFDTPDGLVPLNVLSQGTQSLVQWLARLLIGMAEYYDYPEDIGAKSGILIVDEIDAHLHPSWQRRILPSITKHFPNLQIFCSTHSPLMLAGLKSGQVQLLRRDEDGKVTVSRNEDDIVGWSADEILRSFLDVPSPTDLATVRNLERLQELRQIDNPTEEESRELEQLRETVHHSLSGGPLSKELDRIRGMLNEAMAAGYVSDGASK